ncbi:MAG TPA: class I SAM-dependent methyltransferase [Aliidongia sp.]|uniref:class I SAM-dependent methyltransferase n=1 Tax=Aliidongia sp. TaxID=1914230 RepID=UPI002DDCBCBD|nr:class I SAM-dependent methyltransferase [Aliidongia sp.]HEV2673517.1 class I SAM-dependent methyltransferase [Aliidongia sp.]
MTDNFIPALGRPSLTRYYDRLVSLVARETRWRAAALADVRPAPDDVIVDIGCGTGSLVILMKRACPEARIIGLDPDPAILDIARSKAASAGVEAEWVQGMGNTATDRIGAGIVTKAVSSLVLHHCLLPMKRAILADLFRVLRPGGTLTLVDYGRQPDLLMRLAFLLVRMVDGFGPTGPNAAGILPALIAEAGFADVAAAPPIRTPTGAITLYSARRP